ncbi:MAG: ACT domain-containing protein, partial [Myxococcota bacterium]
RAPADRAAPRPPESHGPPTPSGVHGDAPAAANHPSDDVMVRVGKCCNPLPGDAIVGFVTRGRGITVHTAECPRAMDLDPERRIAVSWDENVTHARPVTLRVLTNDRAGLLATMSQVFSNNGVNIAQANCKVTQKDRAMNTFELLVKDTDQLVKVTGELKSIKGVLGVERL